MTMHDFSQKIILGDTGLSVSRIGIGSGYGVSYKACRKAFESGVNYFFWGSFRTPGMGQAVREIAKKKREELVFALQCYARSRWSIRKSVEKGLKKLNIGYADILLLGWYDNPPDEKIFDAIHRLKERGLFNYLGISSHQRILFPKYLAQGRYDIMHLRYNAAHRGAEQDIFPYLRGESGRPGIVSFTNTRWGDLLNQKTMPSGMTAASAADCYRFVLSNSNVNVALCGPKNDAEMDEALTVLSSGPMTEQEMSRMRTIGDHVHQTRSIMSRLV